MKYYLVTLKNNREKVVEAKSYHKDNLQYVFDRKDPSEVQFFLVSEVVGISVLRDDVDSGGSGLVSIRL